MRTVLGSNWSVRNKKLWTRFDIDLPKTLKVGGVVEIEDGIAFKGSAPYFHLLVSGLHYNDNPLPPAFKNCLVIDTHALNNVNNMEVVFWNAENNRPSLVLNQGATGRASFFDRSVIIGSQKGTKPLDEHYTEGEDFPNLAFNTSLYGSDLGVENDLEVGGIIYSDQVKPSTSAEGVSFDKLKADTIKVDNISIDNVITDLIKVDAVEVNDMVTLHGMAGGGNRAVMVDNVGVLYAA